MTNDVHGPDQPPGSTPGELIDGSASLGSFYRQLQDPKRRPHPSLYHRPNLGALEARVILGPPTQASCEGPAPQPTTVMNLASNSYLGLSTDRRIKDAAVAAMERYGTHTGGPRIFCGTSRLHVDYEARLGAFFGVTGVVTYASGYVANVSVISTLFGAGDAVILDRNAHRSIYDGVLLSGAKLVRFAHNDPAHLDRMLRSTTCVGRRLVAVDSVYSMEGHIAPVPELVEVAHRHGAFILVDEAHAIGVLGKHGRGSAEHFGLDPQAIDIRIGTASKAIPAVGGFALTRGEIAEVLRYRSHGALFSGATTPMDVAVAHAAIGIMEAEPERVARVRDNADTFRRAITARGWDTMGSQTAVVPVRIGDPAVTMDAARRLLDRGVYVNAVIPPGVPPGSDRLRCSVTAAHERGDLEWAAATIHDVLTEMRAAPAATAASRVAG